MAKIYLAGTKNVLFEFPNLVMDEFIPVVEFDRSKFVQKYGLLSAGPEVKLSKYIDESLRTMATRTVDTESRKVKLPFSIKKGHPKTSDFDGIVDVRLSNSDSEVKISGKKSFKVKYGDSIEVEIEIKKNSDVEFDINFYAQDDDEGEINKGELKDLFCGRIKVRFDYTVTTEWETIAPVIPKSKFIGWKHPGVTENCYHYALEQLRQVGKWVKSERWNKKWDGTKELNDHIYQLYLEQDVAGMKKGVQKNQFEPAVNYMKEALKNGLPIMVGVDDDSFVDNDDMTTEHFVTIVGMGSDSKGNYFLFYDNAVGATSVDIGASLENKLYCNARDCIIEGTGDLRNEYIQYRTNKRKYIVSQVRETK
jgi:hypothetical protein